MFDGTPDWYKVWRKTDLCFQKWHEEFSKFSPEHVRNLKIGLLLGLFIRNRKYMSLKFTGELFVMRMKNDARFEEEFDLSIQIWHEEFDKLLHGHSKI